jgi:uncharacterized membrane protein
VIELLIVFLISLLPVLELRGAIVYGFVNGVGPIETYILSVAGNLLPVPFAVLFIRKLLAWLQTKSKFLDRVIKKRVEGTLSKFSKTKYRSMLAALAIFVAIPLPGTGAWTGALIAAFLGIRLKTAFPAIAIGVLIAGLIVTCVTYGIKFAFFT